MPSTPSLPDYQESPHFHRGILNVERFNQLVRLRCYRPSSDLVELVEHYFVARWEVPRGSTYTANDVLTGPVINLFFTADGAYFNGVQSGQRAFRLSRAGVYAGVKFRPGGFHAFWRRPISELTEQRFPASLVFPTVTPAYNRELLGLTGDQRLVARIEGLLREQHPEPDSNIALVGQIMKHIEEGDSDLTVAVLARQLEVPERTLQRLFGQYVGVGVKWHLQRRRLLEAASRVYGVSRANWTTIAAELGYSTQSHFINDFRRLVGMSPSQYAKQVRHTSA